MNGDFDGEGSGNSVEAAAEKAWEDAKSKKKAAGEYEIKKIVVVTQNPIREYKVRIKKT